ncbi:MAG: TenA family protein, partial [Gaiellaceae bacterium]
MLSDDLWQSSRLTAERCLSHPFVLGIASGELPREAFQHYVAQDAFFLDAFARAYALCASRAPDAEAERVFEELRTAVEDELQLHHSYAERWGVDLAVEPAAATRAYTEFLLDVASREPVGHVAAAMAPCMRLYAWLGQELVHVAQEASAYKEWVDTYGSPEFEAHAAKLEALLSALPIAETVARAHYAKAMD